MKGRVATDMWVVAVCAYTHPLAKMVRPVRGGIGGFFLIFLARLLTLGGCHVFLLCLSQLLHPATARPSSPASPSLYCKRETVPRVVVGLG